MTREDDMAEIAYLEQTMHGQARPRFSPEGTCGRLAELYLRYKELPAYAEKALIFVQAGLACVDQHSAFYPKLRHYEAMALRNLQQAEAGSLGMNGTAAQYDREAIDLSYENITAEALLFARQWGDWAWERRIWDEAAEAYSRALRCLHKLLREHIHDEAERFTMLQDTAFVTRGAFALVEIGKFSDAALFLEQANHFFYARFGDAQALQRLAKIDPSLVDEVYALHRDQPVFAERFDHLGRLIPEEQQRMDRRDDVVKRVRAYAGFEDFATLPDWPTIQAVAGRTPLVYLVTSNYGTKMVVLAKNQAASLRCSAISLPHSTEDFRDAVQPFLREEFERSGTVAQRSATLSALLTWLDSALLDQLRALLGELGHTDSQVICIPIGLLALIPWHAGIKRLRYGYSARSINRCEQTAHERVVSHALVIDNPLPLPITFDSLLLSQAEAEVVASSFPTTTLSGRAATNKAFITALPEASLVHLSCHGTVDKRFYYSSVLIFANRQEFTTLNLRALPALSARLVLLSACATGIIALTTEQTSTLPFHFLATGASGVIATLWHSDETATYLLVQKFYETWQADCSPAEALFIAQSWLSQATAATLRASMNARPKASAALAQLADVTDNEIPFAHPWYWANFFLAGS